MKRKALILTLIALGMALAATSTSIDLNPRNWFARNDSVGAPAARSVAAVPADPLPAGITPNYRAIVQQAGPAVVGVMVTGSHELEVENFSQFKDDPFFQFFKGIPGFQWRGQGSGGSIPFHGQGSGFIVSDDGLILTNAHVVRDAKEVIVKLSDRREFKAKVLGADSTTDIAVLRINVKNLPAVRLGDSRQLHVGDPVLAIGSPYGLEQTATQGIVSALGRSLPGDATVPFIQTDAAVNPGNSGGPLFDGSGNVVGINAQIYSQSGGYQGLAFAIPINVAMKVKQQIIATGHASHARLGVLAQNLNQPLAESFGLSRPDGALIVNVAPDSAAGNAGLLPGDVITHINGDSIMDSGDLSSRIGLSSPGDKVKLKIWRNKSVGEIEVKLGDIEDTAIAKTVKETETQSGQLGLKLRPLTRDEKAQLKLKSGLLIEAVTGIAVRAGLLPGDLLLSINGVAVDTLEQVSDVLKKQPKNLALLIQRGAERSFVPLELG